jgi:hypothetical protein
VPGLAGTNIVVFRDAAPHPAVVLVNRERIIDELRRLSSRLQLSMNCAAGTSYSSECDVDTAPDHCDMRIVAWCGRASLEGRWPAVFAEGGRLTTANRYPGATRAIRHAKSFGKVVPTPRFGRKGPGALNFRHKNVGAWLSLVERPVRSRHESVAGEERI